MDQCLAARVLKPVAEPVSRILIFAKAPVAGAVKTRLIPRLGASGAAELAGAMLRATITEARAVAGARVELCAAPTSDHPAWKDMVPADVHCSDQGEGDLGARLARRTREAIEAGEQAILIGGDCPSLGRERLTAAIRALTKVDAFIHPTLDGGYALLALRRYSDRLFEEIRWSTDSVFRQTAERLRQLGWTYTVGETLRDIDEPDDYDAWITSRTG